VIARETRRTLGLQVSGAHAERSNIQEAKPARSTHELHGLIDVSSSVEPTRNGTGVRSPDERRVHLRDHHSVALAKDG